LAGQSLFQDGGAANADPAGAQETGVTEPVAELDLDPAIFDQPATTLAQRLIGVGLSYEGVGGIIVETEAYLRDDPASHSFRGPGRANASMFGPPGMAYVYRSYGLHWCLNAVAADGGAVLIRALSPRLGIERMQQRRGGEVRLCAGPGRLAQALGITGADDGRDLSLPPFRLWDRPAVPPILCGPRIGISRAREQPWRFGLAGSPDLSRSFGRGAIILEPA
jgi:DNA-3-methyladenine glycosylase